MKKILAILITSSIFISSLFAVDGIMGHRFFEFSVGTAVQASNSYIKPGDLLNGGDLVIDLRELADSIPSSGYKVAVSAKPEFGFCLNVPRVSVGAYAGVDVGADFRLGKGLFELLGYGNELYEEISVDADISADIFATLRIPVAVDVRRINVKVEPAFFIPIIHAGAENVNLSIKNNEDAQFLINGGATLNFFSLISYANLLDERGQIMFGPQSISEMITAAFADSSLGFDVTGSFNYRFSDILMFTSNARIPLVPGKLAWLTPVKCSFSYEVAAADFLGGDEGVKAPEFTVEDIASSNENYRLNRPLRLNAGVRFSPLETDMIVLTGNLGFGVKHPFSSYKSEIVFYPEYDFAVAFNLASLLQIKLSTSYIEQVFINQAAFGFNVRVLEINAGISAQSTSIKSALKGCGVGAYINLAMGF